jgi:hypothetical protein
MVGPSGTFAATDEKADEPCADHVDRVLILTALPGEFNNFGWVLVREPPAQE